MLKSDRWQEILLTVSMAIPLISLIAFMTARYG